MPFHEPHHPLHGLGPKWARAYSGFLLSAIAVRALARSNRTLGCAQDILADSIREAADVADSLAALGYDPGRSLAGGEASVWQAAVRYLRSVPLSLSTLGTGAVEIAAACDRWRDGWASFVGCLAAQPDEALASSAVLDPSFLQADGLSKLFGERRRHVPEQLGREFGYQPGDEPVVAVRG